MYSKELMGLYPRKRIRAVDGMAVTAEVWEEAHDYHRQLGQLHTALHHGGGIVSGLEVIASDPADNAVYVQPGLAVDPLGHVMVVPEPRAFDLGIAEGRLFLILSYNESRPQSQGARVQEDAPLYVYSQYTLEAVTDLPHTPHVELARIWRRDQTSSITAAVDPASPRPNEIDLRFRVVLTPATPPTALVGVVGLRGSEGAKHGEGISALAATMRRSGVGQVWVDRGVTLNAELLRYDLLYVVGRDAVQLSSEEMNALYVYWQAGGMIFYESCRRNQSQGNPPADAVFLELLAAFGVQLQPLARDHDLLRGPYLFGEPPAGFETLGSPEIRMAEGILMSTADYGCLWRGERRTGPARRGEIRDAHEWGANLLLWAAAQRQTRLAALTARS